MQPIPHPIWLPAPRKRGWTAVAPLCLALVGLAVLGLAETGVVWRADAADQRGDFARAVAWRPDVPLYRRQLGESLLMTSPARSEDELLQALRLDPYDPIAIADLTTTELALGHWPRAVSTTQSQERQMPTNFASYWRLANLYLTRGDRQGFFQQTALACRYALPNYFEAVVPRALSASHNDFAALRRALPPDSVAAASAYVAAAAALDNRTEVGAGADWLLSLPTPADPAVQQSRVSALQAVLTTTWQQWPEDASALEARLRRVGLMPLTMVKAAQPPFLADSDFDPAQQAALSALSPDGALAAVLGWRRDDNPGVVAHDVLTEDGRHPTALELAFDGTEGLDLALLHQWFLAPGGARLELGAIARRLDNRAEQGLTLRVSTLAGQSVGEVPLALAGEWQPSQGAIALPPGNGGVQAWDLTLRYRRPSGDLPMQSRVLVTGVRLEPGAGR